MKFSLLFLSLFIVVSFSHAKVYSPKVLTQHVADLSGNWQNFLQYQDFQGKTGQALAEAVFSYLTDTVTGFYHSVDIRGDYTGWEDRTGVRAQQEVVSNYGERIEFCVVRDPVLSFNVHGYGLCFHNSDCWNGVMKSLGFDVRCGSMRNYHKFSEIYFAGAWHYIDPDQRGYVKKADGTIPSWADLAANSSLFDANPFNVSPYFPFQKTNPIAPGLLTFSMIKGMADSTRLQSTFSETFPSPNILTHTMDYVLRRGETIRRYWQSDSGRFYLAIEQWNRNTTTAGSYWAGVANSYWPNFSLDPQGPKSFESGLGGSANKTGFGIITYAPDLGDASTDYADGVYADSNVAQNTSGVFLSTDGSGYVVFKTYSPYTIIARANDVQIRSDDTGGAIINYQTQGATQVSYSITNGETWVTLESGTALNSVHDLSIQMYGRYGYLVKFTFTGTTGSAGLVSFGTRTLVSVAPMPLPRLKTGSNTIIYSTGDVRGEKTTPINMHLDISDSAYAKRMMVQNTTTYDPRQLTTKMRNGDVTFKVLAPHGSKIKWCSMAAHVYGGWSTAYDYSFNVSPDNSSFTTFGTYATQAGRHWNATFNQTSELADYGNIFYARFHAGSSGGMNRLYLYAHYEDSVSAAEDQAVVTYGYEEDGVPKTHTFNADSGAVENLSISGAVVNKWVEISNPSSTNGTKIKGTLPNLKKKAGLEIYPNPFNPSVRISGTGQYLTNTNQITVEIFDVHGKLIQKLPASGNEFSKGVIWNASSQPSGVYLIRAQAGNVTLDSKAYLIR
ncbi:MAG: hypothetical protein A2268_13505 [Candidatus Raymondbacteria bacterium RifOxyA12_full_50_37]|uniref:Secretion system C-terminal sorting domain-containing protein n=1 Tax=Candidatus Raymondbacteria bacterium RIFOXYD12_FULL_49_13 TaxID=1817890 RepID=A0A1F7F8X8_UNCRA|nr:MAG: hypothetical protein A2268_13505 [Candidatus Raymondbacteria bacterium RifOxyA12_full_50_37]OGJ91515.1 MAG: hypothetical protein A2248_03690 [Candidatus Raymondbacteria bacterium RIFOXYA2_FULL_49_16]OGJ93065.1 MAG: hypothetical protein A2350_04790 [Candidatus Raymondbacteria bacterium RifOxyB12_full_50_8]OGJ97829.1 MAG: hypothetical protein A2453_14075 [Candidatus Raymondbacteria bacterium RIFOXYC2_FULL_50_21]OGK02976.1 MAG: hypothetical protein A2519_06430 [Candidatus Raymondbacteria b